MVLLRARLLGVPRFESGCGKLIANPGPKPTALFAYLASQADGRASRAELSQLFWGDARSTAAARQGLRQCILRLRQHFKDAGSFVRSDNSAIWLDLDLVEVDVRHLEGIPRRGVADVVAAARLCNGTFCAMLEVDQPDFEAWLRQRRSEVDRLSASVNSEAAEMLAIQGHHEAAIRAARRHVAIEPFDEQAHAALIGFCMRFGRRQDARVAHAECLSVFRTELGIAPGAEIDAALQVVPFDTNRMPPSLPGDTPHRSKPFAFAAVGAVGLMLAASLLLVIARVEPDMVPATNAETPSSTRMWVTADGLEIERLEQIDLFVDQDRVGTEGAGNVRRNEAVQRAIAGDKDFAQYYPIGC
jgi:DNA-binding SARP family transcriptional activator